MKGVPVPECKSRRALSRRRDDGASAVEFALVVVPLLVVVFGILQYGWYFYSSQVGASTAREAARRVAVGDCNTQAQLDTFVQNYLGGASTGTPTVVAEYIKPDGSTTTAGDPDAIGGKVTVTLTFQSLDMNFPFIPVPDGAKVTRIVDARIEDDQSSGCA